MSQEPDELETHEELVNRILGHDQKNLQNLINGYQEMMDVTEDEEEEREYEQKIEYAKRGIENLYSRFEEEASDYGLTFNQLIGQSMNSLRPRLCNSQKNVEINWNDTKTRWRNNSYDTEFDPIVERMVANLLDNSIEHGEGDIRVDIDRDEEKIGMEVYDGGHLEMDEWSEILKDSDDITDYPSTGSYIIDQVARKNNIEITPTESGYQVELPRKK